MLGPQNSGEVVNKNGKNEARTARPHSEVRSEGVCVRVCKAAAFGKCLRPACYIGHDAVQIHKDMRGIA